MGGVRQIGSSAPIGQFCCKPAGGNNTPWSATVSYSGATQGVITVVASTGGHLQGVERFAIQALQAG